MPAGMLGSPGQSDSLEILCKYAMFEAQEIKCSRVVWWKPPNRLAPQNEEGVAGRLGSCAPPTPVLLVLHFVNNIRLTLYCLVSSVRRSLFSRMSGLGWNGERE